MVRAPRLWVIDPSIHEAEDQCVQEVLGGWSGESRVLRPSLAPGDGPGPGDGHDVDGVVVLGSSASVHDGLRWVEELTGWLEPVLRGIRPLPLLGICFGHQLVAHIAGAEVADLDGDGRKQVGCQESAIEASRLLPGSHRLRVMVSHREVVRTVPPGYRVVARRPTAPLDGFEHERLPVFTFQFHPEAREEFAVRRGLDPACVDDRLRRDSGLVLDAFRRWVLASCSR